MARRTQTWPPFRSYGVPVAPGTEPIYLYLGLSKYHKDGADAIDRQRIDLTRKLGREGGWTIMGEYVDNDSASVSAARNRRGWQALNAAIDRGEATAVAFWKLDRTNRVATKIIEWLGICRTNGVTLRSHEDSDDELNTASANAKLITGIKSIFAEIETDTMSTRQKASKQHLAEAGFVHGGATPFGWQTDPAPVADDLGRRGKRLVPHPIEFPALQEAVTMVLDGASLADVARYWHHDLGIMTREGDPIPAGNVRRYLASPRLMGYRMRQVPEHKRGVKINLLDHIARDAAGEPVIAQEPVCDRVTWTRLQQILTDRRTANLRGPWKREWLLTGLFHCQTCGQRMQAKLKKNRSGETVGIYVCGDGRNGRTKICGRRAAILQSKAETFVLGEIAARLSPERLAAWEALADESAPGSRASNVAYALEEAKAELAELLAQQGTDRWKGAKVAILAGMIADASDRVDKLETDLDAVRATDSVLAGDVLLERWPDMSLNEKRALLRKVITKIEIRPGREPAAERIRVDWLI